MIATEQETSKAPDRFVTVRLTREQAAALEYAGRYISEHLYTHMLRNVKVWALEDGTRALREAMAPPADCSLCGGSGRLNDDIPCIAAECDAAKRYR